MSVQKEANFFEVFFGLGGQQSVDFWQGVNPALQKNTADLFGGTIGQMQEKALPWSTVQKAAVIGSIILIGLYLWKKK